MRKSSIGLLLTLAAVFPAAARAGGVEVTPFLGYRLSVDFKDVGTDSSRLDESATYGLMIDIPLNDRTRLELLVDLQETDLVKSEVFGDPELFPVDVSYFQVGATREWETQKRGGGACGLSSSAPSASPSSIPRAAGSEPGT